MMDIAKCQRMIFSSSLGILLDASWNLKKQKKTFESIKNWLVHLCIIEFSDVNAGFICAKRTYRTTYTCKALCSTIF